MQNKKRKTPFRYLPMDAGRLVCSVLLPIYRQKRIHISGKKYNNHLKGGVIVVSNHTGFSDPFLIGTTFWYRRTFFLAAKEVMRNGFIEFLLKGMGCIKIDREISDINAIRKCVDILKDGKLLSMFPQGGITADGEVDKIKAGAILIAMQAGVPIVPAYTVKREHWWNRQRIVIGDEFNCREMCNKRFPSVNDMAELSEKLLEKMEECKRKYEQYE